MIAEGSSKLASVPSGGAASGGAASGGAAAGGAAAEEAKEEEKVEGKEDSEDSGGLIADCLFYREGRVR